MKLKLAKIAIFTAGLLLSSTAFSDSSGKKNKPVGITGSLMSTTVKHQGKDVTIVRDQNNAATIIPAFAKTSRPCPPFCIQPMVLAPGVETLGENEVIDYLDKIYNQSISHVLVVDSRDAASYARGTIPGAKNIFWKSLSPKKGATTEGIMQILQQEFGVKLANGVDSFTVDEAIAAGDTSKVFDFTNAQTLVMFCNGMWCGQSPTNIKSLLKFGYPANKIKWYRGGMQDWLVLGFSTGKG